MRVTYEEGAGGSIQFCNEIGKDVITFFDVDRSFPQDRGDSVREKEGTSCKVRCLIPSLGVFCRSVEVDFTSFHPSRSQLISFTSLAPCAT